jgi:ATP-dependent helicase/nuclease subunit A
VPEWHLRQMAAYAAALAVIFPDRPVAAALLYTAGPRWIELPAQSLAAHKPRYRTPEQS